MNIIFEKINQLNNNSNKSSDLFMNQFLELIDVLGKQESFEDINNVDSLGNSISVLIYNLYEMHRVTAIFNKKQLIPVSYMKEILKFLNQKNADFSLSNLKNQNLYSLSIHYKNWEILLFLSQLNDDLFIKEYLNLQMYRQISTFDFLLKINNLNLPLGNPEDYKTLVNLNGLSKVEDYLNYIKEKRMILELIK